jgi:hypothetical protein
MFIPVRSVPRPGVEPRSPAGGYESNAFPSLSPAYQGCNNGVQKYKKMGFLKILLSTSVTII